LIDQSEERILLINRLKGNNITCSIGILSKY